MRKTSDFESSARDNDVFDRYSPFKGKPLVPSLKSLGVTHRFGTTNIVVDGIQTFFDFSIGGRGYIFKGERYEAVCNRYYAYSSNVFGNKPIQFSESVKLYDDFREFELGMLKRYLSDFVVDQQLLPERYADRLFKVLEQHEKPPKEFEKVTLFANLLLNTFVKAEYPSKTMFVRHFYEWLGLVSEVNAPKAKPCPPVPEKGPARHDPNEEIHRELAMAIEVVKETKKQVVLVLSPVTISSDGRVEAVSLTRYTPWRPAVERMIKPLPPPPLNEEESDGDDTVFVTRPIAKPPNLMEDASDGSVEKMKTKRVPDDYGDFSFSFSKNSEFEWPRCNNGGTGFG